MTNEPYVIAREAPDLANRSTKTQTLLLPNLISKYTLRKSSSLPYTPGLYCKS